MTSPAVRLMIFRDRPDCLVVYLRAGESVTLPELTSPFTKEDLLRTCPGARITEATSTGRFTKSITALSEADRAATETARLRAQVLLTSNNPIERQRAVLTEKRLALETEIRKLKDECNTTDLSRNAYRVKQERLTEARTEVQNINAELSVLRQHEKEANAKAVDSEYDLFKRAVKAAIGEEAYMRIVEGMQEDGT